jgi:hypothetical protein
MRHRSSSRTRGRPLPEVPTGGSWMDQAETAVALAIIAAFIIALMASV